MNWAKKEFPEWPMQTDSIYETVKVSDIEAYLCTATAYSKTLKRYIPIFASILMGHNAKHFEKHFDFLFRILGTRIGKNEQLENFEGMTCDFSSAEYKGFKLSFEKNFPGIDFNTFYGTCKVHFKRSLKRVESSNTLVPLDKKKTFFSDTMQLFEISHLKVFEAAVKSWKQQYPQAKTWLDWYLSPSRRSSVFDVFLSTDRASKISKDTNAQEGVGGDIKRSFRHLPSDIDPLCRVYTITLTILRKTIK
jgi:hypothetical protein